MVNDVYGVILKLTKIEENTGKLYGLFSKMHPSDFAFWTQLANEEKNHAHLLKINRDYIASSPILYKYLLATSVETLQNINEKIEEIIASCEMRKLARMDCLMIGLQIEQSAGELNYQQTMASENDDIVLQVMKLLSTEDHNHAKQITQYMQAN